MSTVGNRVLSKMLDRLLAGLMSGPNMNCRPHNSRQRIDLTQLEKLADLSPTQVLQDLLGTQRCAKTVARVKMPRKISRDDGDAEQADPKSPGEKSWTEQTALLNKLRLIADDARTYENDTGVHALGIGFPLLSLPPGSFGGGPRAGTKRILAPIAFVPVTLSLKAGATPSVEISCQSEGADRVRSNTALLSWIEQQTGKPQPQDLFEDEEGTDPWREIERLVEHVASALGLEVPQIFKPIPIVEDIPETTGEVTQNPATLPIEQPPGVSLEATSPQPADPDPLEIPKDLSLEPAPRGDEDSEHPAILITAVLGLFPTAHQGLLRDTRAMLTETFTGPIQSFLTTGIDFDAPALPGNTAEIMPKQPARSLANDRLAAAADPCQARAVALAREAAGLVVHGPPGTGKSQTITNIIADHLSRGQRVLLVCEKRTALDVVADRLEHMGLRSLCGIVHDPQRDQRDLYRSIRQQLDELPEAKTYPRAEAALAKVDAELQQLHDELTAYHDALMHAHGSNISFHELMGQWLSSKPDATVRLDDAITASIKVEDVTENRPGLIDLFRRAAGVTYSKNPWADCAGVTLADYLARPMSDVRTRMDRILAAAVTADGTLDPAIPPFNDKAPLLHQATARTRLADRLDELLGDVHAMGQADLTGKNATDVRSTIDWVHKHQDMIHAMRGSSLDPQLVAMLQPMPAFSEINEQASALQDYQTASQRWTGVFKFSVNAAAKKVLLRYGFPLSIANAEKVSAFLAAVKPRYALTVIKDTFLKTQANSAPSALASDELLEHFFRTVESWAELMLTLWQDPALDGLIAITTKTLPREESATVFIDGLRKSAARAEALVKLDEQLVGSQLFDLNWLNKFDADLHGGKSATETATTLRDRLDALEGVLRVRAGRAVLPAVLLPSVDVLLDQLIEPEAAFGQLHRCVTAGEIVRRLRADPTLQSKDAHRIESMFHRHRELDLEKKKLVREVILHQWILRQQERLLAGTGSRLNAAGADLRRRLTSRGERAMRLRQVIAIGERLEGGDPLFDLCPIWMASPETVAQVFPRKAMFDVIVFDEASQCRLEEALPVLTRGKRVVIAGDPNQLPPTRFFESGVVQSEEEDPETEQELFEHQQGEIEDLLAAALNLAIQQCYLDVHYRSRNADLIEFSNHNFYGNRLQAIPAHPANRGKVSPLLLYRVDGIYNKRQNEAEADRVVAIVRELLESEAPPSIGIACLNLPQRDLITQKLDDLAGDDAAFAKKLAAARVRKGEGSFEGLFIKNLENVQGDERDDIIISTTYGPDTKGKFYRRFGPLGMNGGGRRLNVLVTRARNRVHLVTSIPVEAYRTLPAIPEGQTATGAWLLFAYLNYAEQVSTAYTEREMMSAPSPNGNDVTAKPVVTVLPTKTPSLFSEQLADTLSASHQLGSDVHWGNEGFCVDLAMHDPANAGGVTIGVLCDGCRYAAADDPVEWDIFRTGILESQGWKLRRVWTPHFFRDPEGNMSSVATAALQQ